MMTLKEAYDILGVDSSATPKKINAAYRQLCLRYHPDKYRVDGLSAENAKEYATELMKRINLAKEVINNSLSPTAFAETSMFMGSNPLWTTNLYDSPFSAVSDLRERLIKMIDETVMHNIHRVDGTLTAIRNSGQLLASLNLRNPDDGNTAFHYAAQTATARTKSVGYFFLGLCEIAFDAGFYFGTTNNQQQTPLDIINDNPFGATVGLIDIDTTKTKVLLMKPNISYACRLVDEFLTSVKNPRNMSEGLMKLASNNANLSNLRYQTDIRLSAYQTVIRDYLQKKDYFSNSAKRFFHIKTPDSAESLAIYNVLSDIIPASQSNNDISYASVRTLEEALVNYVIKNRDNFDIFIDPHSKSILFAESEIEEPILCIKP
jgi:hypothetical protein